MTANFSTFTRRATHLLAVACLFTAVAPADTIRVPGDQPTIQAGIDAAVNGDLVLIADGVYTGTGNKNLDFAGKAITVRGENGRDNCIIDCEQDGRAFHFHSGEGPDSVIDGLTIRNGRILEGDPISDGGAGILCVGSSPTIDQCAFEACFADGRGGGVHLGPGSDAIIQGCAFRDNRAFCGGGVAIEASSPTVTECDFTGNSASPAGDGAGLFCVLGDARVIDCSFVGNSGTALVVISASALIRGCFFGGNRAFYSPAIDTRGSSVTVMRCRFVSNFASEGDGAVSCSPDTVLMNCEFYLNRTGVGSGGAISVRGGTVVQNCTFARNTAGMPGGAVRANGSASTFSNCIFWENDSPWIVYRDEPPLVSHSVVQGGWPGEGNIDLDPRFVDLENGDLHLLPDSPAIGTGDPDFVPSPGETDIDGQKRIWNARVDMGADEFGSFAFGDLNCDGRFDALDIEPFIVALFEPAAYPTRYPDCELLLGDINGDQSVDALDIELFIDLLFGA